MNQEYLNELDMAKRVQEGLLSLEPPQIEGVRIARRCIPASNVGGDFYTFIGKSMEKLTQKVKSPGIFEYVPGVEHNLGIAIGDVAGHGVSSALVMALSAGLIDKIAQNNDSPKEILERANNDIHRFISNSQISHLTAFYAAINTQQKIITYSKAGHHPVILLKKDDTTEELDAEGTFLGMYENEQFEEKTATLNNEDRLFFFTDGIIEALNNDGEEYGEARFIKIAIENKDKNGDELINLILNDLENFRSGPAKDDQTMVIVDIL